MGNELSTGIDRWLHPEYAPVVTKPPVFDPLQGFPKGRKKREMIATWEEMENYNLDWHERDYCAHTYINWRKCMLTYAPFQTPLHCGHQRHAHELCEWEDYILRVKEYERERRLLEREYKLKKKQEIEQKEQSS